MKANELRIGNWIETPRGFQQIKEIGVKNNEYYATFYNLHEGYYLSSCNPIPLTVERLIKVGFEKINDRQFTMLLNDSIAKITIWIDRQCIELSNTYGNGFLFIDLSFIHQLQNLFYCLTGGELEVGI